MTWLWLYLSYDLSQYLVIYFKKLKIYFYFRKRGCTIKVKGEMKDQKCSVEVDLIQLEEVEAAAAGNNINNNNNNNQLVTIE